MELNVIAEPFYLNRMTDFTENKRLDVQYNLLDSFLVYYLKVTGDVNIQTTFIPSKNGGNNQNG
jgi:hypothetical protein